MRSSIFVLSCSFIGLSSVVQASNPPCDIQVSTVTALNAAIVSALPGNHICLQPGLYDGDQTKEKSITIDNKHGKVNQPITLRGQPGVVITNSDSNYAIHLLNSSYIRLENLTISDVKKAIMLDGSTRISMEGLTVNRVAEEAIHFRKNSTHNVLINSTVSHIGVDTKNGHTGLKRFGEAIYVGSAKSNWKTLMGGADTPDVSSHNCIAGNTIGPFVSAEAIDVKEGTSHTYILGNVFDLTGISGYNFADSALDLKGSRVFVGNNQFINLGNTYIEKLYRIASGKDLPIDAPGKLAGKITPDAIQTHIVPTSSDLGSGSEHRIWGNVADLKSAGRPEGYVQGMLLRVDDDSGQPNPLGTRLCQGNSAGKDDLLSNIPATQCDDIPTIKTCPLVLSQPL